MTDSRSNETGQKSQSHEYNKLLRKIVLWGLCMSELKQLGWGDEAIYACCWLEWITVMWLSLKLRCFLFFPNYQQATLQKQKIMSLGF